MPKLTTLAALIFLIACGGEAAEPSAAEATGGEEPAGEAAAPSEEAAVAAQPDLEKLSRHVDEHLKVPATRDEILAACAETQEFTEGEKQWIADHLTENSYETVDSVKLALGL